MLSEDTMVSPVNPGVPDQGSPSRARLDELAARSREPSQRERAGGGDPSPHSWASVQVLGRGSFRVVPGARSPAPDARSPWRGRRGGRTGWTIVAEIIWRDETSPQPRPPAPAFIRSWS